VSGISLIVTIALDLLLIPNLNILGAAIASSVSYSLSALLLIVFFIRETGASLREVLLPTSEDMKILLSVARLRRSESTV
jgi:Na+-driven multidrug efflux pump